MLVVALNDFICPPAGCFKDQVIDALLESWSRLKWLEVPPLSRAGDQARAHRDACKRARARDARRLQVERLRFVC